MKRRVVIVGGGIAGLTAAYELTRTPEARARWDVEIVEMGHRLGGRLASAHHPERWGRNQEHGLHVWFGFYDNTFRLAEQVWRDWNRPEGCPWTTVWDGLRPIFHSDHGLVEGERFAVRRVHHPRNCDRPGEATMRSGAGHVSSLLDSLRTGPGTLLSMLAQRSLTPRRERLADRLVWPSPERVALIREIDRWLKPLLTRISPLASRSTAARLRLGRSLHGVLRCVHGPLVRSALSMAGREPGAIALAHSLDVALATARGVCSHEHGILVDGDFDRISGWELRDWLAHHGVQRSTLEHSRLIEATYDMPFAFLEGDRSRPVMEASTALRYTLRMMFFYKHAIAYLLTAGAGETLIAPLYALLEERGVRFRPFHRLESVRVDRGSRTLSELTFVRAARVEGRYDPLTERRGFAAFRAEPDWSQIEDGESLRRRGVDFYSRFADRGEATRVSMCVGRDFDDVVLALPLGSIAADGDGHSPVEAWLDYHRPARTCLERLHLVPTVAAQVWFSEPPDAIGLTGKSLVTWCAPYSVVCEMSPVIAHEDWGRTAPGSCAYLCGPWPLRAHRAPSTDHDALSADEATARSMLVGQIERHGDSLFTATPSFHRPADAVDALEAQYVRANVQPWDLADLPLPGANAVRLEATDTGLSNMSLAGSWVRTSINTTSVEAAVSSGIAAARALGADVQLIHGETFFRRPPRVTVLPDREEKPDAVAPPVQPPSLWQTAS